MLAWIAPALSAQTATLPEKPGKSVVERVCAPCHGLAIVTATQRTREEWQDVVGNMVGRGAKASNSEVDQIVRYLSANFGRTNTSARSIQPLPARKLVISEQALKQQVPGETDWPSAGHDSGATRYSPLAQINTANVAQLSPAWKFDTGETGRPFEVTPIVVENTMYLMTPSQHIVALEPETGRQLWSYDAHVGKGSVGRGVSYWPGDKTTGPRILFGTDKAQLIGLDAKTGQPAKEFGDNGIVNVGAGRTDLYPHARYAITSPPAIYRNLVIIGPEGPEGPSHGPPGDARAYSCENGRTGLDTSLPSSAPRTANRLGDLEV